MPTNNNIGAYSKPFVSAVSLLDARDIWPNIVDLQDDAEWTQLMLEMGKRSVAIAPFYDNFYNESKFIIVDTTGATVTNSGTATVTVTNLAAGSNNYIIVGDTLMLPNGKNALVTTLSTTTLANDTIVMKSVDGTNLTLVTGDKISVIGTAMEEASNSPSPRRLNLASIRNNIQIFSEAFKITDIQGMSHRVVKVDGDPRILPQAAIDTLQLLRGKQAATWWAGRVSATLFSDASPALTGPQGNGVQTTRGLDQYVTSYGINTNTAIAGQVDFTDIDNIGDLLDAVKAPYEYMVVGANSAKNVFDKWLKNLGSSGVQSVRLQGDGKDTNFEAEAFEYGGHRYNLKRLKMLSNPQLFNYVASGGVKPEIARSLYFLPMGRLPIYGGSGQTGGTSDYFGMRYMQTGPGMSDGVKVTEGHISEFHNGALAPNSIGTGAFYECRYYSQMGTDIKKPQVFARMVVN